MSGVRSQCEKNHVSVHLSRVHISQWISWHNITLNSIMTLRLFNVRLPPSPALTIPINDSLNNLLMTLRRTALRRSSRRMWGRSPRRISRRGSIPTYLSATGRGRRTSTQTVRAGRGDWPWRASGERRCRYVGAPHRRGGRRGRRS